MNKTFSVGPRATPGPKLGVIFFYACQPPVPTFPITVQPASRPISGWSFVVSMSTCNYSFGPLFQPLYSPPWWHFRWQYCPSEPVPVLKLSQLQWRQPLEIRDRYHSQLGLSLVTYLPMPVFYCLYFIFFFHCLMNDNAWEPKRQVVRFTLKGWILLVISDSLHDSIDHSYLVLVDLFILATLNLLDTLGLLLVSNFHPKFKCCIDR